MDDPRPLPEDRLYRGHALPMPIGVDIKDHKKAAVYSRHLVCIS